MSVQLSHDEGICTVVLAGGNALNSFSSGLLAELEEALREVSNDEKTRVVIFTGWGDRAFSAGGDIPELRDMTAEQAAAHSRKGQTVFETISSLATPSIAAVNGLALGAGCELAMACDMRLASSTAKFGLPEVALGVMPGWGGTQRLPQIVGRARGLQMILTGELIGADEAAAAGLVNKVVPPAELAGEALRLARTILRNGPFAVQAAKLAVREGLRGDSATGLEAEASLFGQCFGPEQREGMSAFLEKRRPNWTE